MNEVDEMKEEQNYQEGKRNSGRLVQNKLKESSDTSPKYCVLAFPHGLLLAGAGPLA